MCFRLEILQTCSVGVSLTTLPCLLKFAKILLDFTVLGGGTSIRLEGCIKVILAQLHLLLHEHRVIST